MEPNIYQLAKNGLLLQHVKNQTPEMCMVAVKQNVSALQFVKDQTYDICMEAIKKNWTALQYIKNPTIDLELEAVRRHPNALYLIKNRTIEMLYEAMKCDRFDLLKQNDLKTIAQYIELKSKLPVEKRFIVYEDLTNNTFKKIEVKNDVNSSIIDYINEIYGNQVATDVKNICNDQTSVEKMMNEKYIGIFYVKTGDQVYELYDKKEENINIGWIRNNFVKKYTTIKLGRFIIA